MSDRTNAKPFSFDLESERSIVEREERFEQTTAALETDRCSYNAGTTKVA